MVVLVLAVLVLVLVLMLVVLLVLVKGPITFPQHTDKGIKTVEYRFRTTNVGLRVQV